MTAAAPVPTGLVSYAEYLEFEMNSPHKHEFHQGRIVRMMVGGTWNHSTLISNCHAHLFNRLPGGPCRPFVGDARTRIEAEDRALYPDLLVLCGEREKAADDDNACTNPTVVVEVLSPSTEGYDRGRKHWAYASLPSLQHYVLIAQDAVGVDVFTRSEDGWTVQHWAAGQAVPLPAIGIELPVDDLYEGVDVSESADSIPPAP